MVLVVCVAALTAVSMQVRCVDAAREAARLAARGDERAAVDVARMAAPRGATVGVRRSGALIVATVSSRADLLPGLVISATQVAAVEPPG